MALLENQISNEYLRFLIIIIGTIIFVTISYLILRIIVKKISRGKKSYAQFILKQLSIPVFFFVFIIGVYTSLKTLSRLDTYFFEIDGAFFIITTLIIALLASRIITVITMGWLKVRRGFKRTPGLLNKAITAIIFVIAIAVILAYFEIDITPLIAGVGLGALAIGLALQSTLSNFFAGLHLLSDKPINVGDFIELDENTSGIVEDIGWRSTRIRMLTDNLLIIPNSKLAESNIINYSMPKQDFSIWIPCGVAYESDLKKVEKVTLEVAREIQKTVPGAAKDFEPGFRYREFGDSNINFIAILRIEHPMDRFIVRNEFIKALKERFDKENIEISWPIRKIYNIKK
jgi:small-conductance mechanosensitive channel